MVILGNYKYVHFINMQLELLHNCYENYLNIDLKSIHIDMNRFSDNNNGVKLEIEDLDLIKHPVGFTNESNEVFKLVNFDNRNFLSSKSKCYPCSRVYENIHGHRFVLVLIIPKSEKLKILNDNSSVRYSFNVGSPFSVRFKNRIFF